MGWVIVGWDETGYDAMGRDRWDGCMRRVNM